MNGVWMTFVLITGMPASRKSLFAQLLADKLRWPIIPLSAKLHEYFSANPNELDPASYRTLSRQIRAELGADALARLALDGWPRQQSAIVDGVRSRAEVELFREHSGCLLVAVVCPLRARKHRYSTQNRGLHDPLKALAEQDQNDLNLGVGNIIAQADAYAHHDGNLHSLEAIAQQLAQGLAL
jgi:dephospho-CoA kinase